MCHIFGKKNEHEKKSVAKPHTKMPCWTLFYTSKKNQKEKDKEKQKTENNSRSTTKTECLSDQFKQNGTPSLLADLPSTNVKSIEINRELSLSKPINSTAFEWNNLGTKTRSSQQTKESKEVKTVKIEKNKQTLKCPIGKG